jgi:hypothetical protein
LSEPGEQPKSEELEPLGLSPVIIEVPEPISPAGLVETQVTTANGISRFARHAWGDHEIVITTEAEPEARRDGALRFRITDRVEPFGAPELRVTIVDGPGLAGISLAQVDEACRSTEAPFLSQRISVQLAVEVTGTGGGVRISMLRLPGMPSSFAYRRGIRFAIAMLVSLDRVRGRSTPVFIEARGCGRLDLADAHHRLTRTTRFGVSSIDPEAELVEVRQLVGTDWTDPAFLRNSKGEIASALGCDAEDAYVLSDESDLLAGQFGVSPTRAGRLLVATRDRDTVSLAVFGTAERGPIRGYVTFYLPSSVAPGPIRALASEGVARCRVASPLRDGVTVGAIVEDDRVVLEARVRAAVTEPPPKAEPPGSVVREQRTISVDRAAFAALSRAVEDYRGVLDQSQWRERVAIDDRLAKMNPRPSIADLMSFLGKEPDRETQMAVAVVLGTQRRGEPDLELAEVLAGLLASAYSRVRFRAAGSIERHATQRGLESGARLRLATAVGDAIKREGDSEVIPALRSAEAALTQTK